jgi:hypothetical protein
MEDKITNLLLKHCHFAQLAVVLAILISVFWDKVTARFGGTYGCHVQGRSMWQAMNNTAL